MEDGNYILAKQIKECMEKVRRQYRLKSRDSLYEDVVKKMKMKYNSAIDDYEKAKADHKDKQYSLEEKQSAEMNTIKERHKAEIQQIEEIWNSPEKVRQFTHRSMYSLQQKAIERFLLMSENYEAADNQRKINAQLEKKEVMIQQEKMKNKFESEIMKLIDTQENELRILKEQHDIEKALQQKEENNDLDTKKKRVEILEQELKDEAEFDKFIAKTYRCTSDRVLPPTVSIMGGRDLPPLSKGRSIPVSNERLLQIKNSPVATPLELPPLTFKANNRMRASH